jgi:hypothetical protein
MKRQTYQKIDLFQESDNWTIGTGDELQRFLTTGDKRGMLGKLTQQLTRLTSS